MGHCPPLEQLRPLLAGDLSGPEWLAAESHVEACPSCQRALMALLDDEAAEAAHLMAIGGRARADRGEDAEFLKALKAVPPLEVWPSFHRGDTQPSSGPPPPPDPGPLPRVPGYTLLAELGRGGMGVVYRARQASLNRPVALKMILAGARATASERDRFRREAEAVARIQHPNIVQVYEIGEYDGQPYLALELVEGGNLAEQLRGEPQPAWRSAELVETLARAVHAAHQHGVIHRDLKPANILITPSGVPKIADFGLAKCLDAGLGGPTSTGQLLGTPSYMAPEQATPSGGASVGGAGPGPSADVYSVGAILYELLTGRPPFRAETALETVLQVLNSDPVPPARLRSKLPRDLETICLACLRKDPARRYPSALSVAEDLRRFLAGEPIRARPVSARERLWKWARRRPAAAGLAVGAALALVLSFAELTLLWRVAEARAHLERKAKEAEVDALRGAERRNAGLLVDRNLALCERGGVAQGMLGLADALARAPAEAADLDRAIRANLAAWRYRLATHRYSLRHAGRVRAVSYSHDGRFALTGSEDATARLWDVATGEPLGPPLEHSRAVIAVALSPDDRIALTGGADDTARLWDAATGEPLGPPLDHEGAVRLVAFRPDGRVILTGANDAARLWDAATGRPIGEPMRHDGEVLAAAFGPDGGVLLTGGRDRTARLWDAATGRPIGEPLPHEDAVSSVAFSPDGRRAATAGRDGAARLWDPAEGRPCHPPLRHPYPVWAVSFSPDGRTLLTGSGLTGQFKGEARLWDCATGLPLGIVMLHNSRVGCVAWSPNGRHILTGGEEKPASLWLAAADKPDRRPIWHGGSVHALAFGPDGRTFLTASEDDQVQPPRGEAKLCEAPLEQQVGPTLRHPPGVTAVAFSPDGRTIATGGTDRAARLWDAATGRSIGEPLPHPRPVRTVAFSPDGRIVVTGESDRAVRLWDAATGRPVGEPLPHPGSVLMVAYSPDGKTIATVGQFPAVRLWDVATGRTREVPLPHHDFAWAVAFSPDGRTVATGGTDRAARLWDAATGRSIGEPLPHPRPVRAVSFSPGGRTLLTGCADMTAQLWDTATGRPATAPLLHPDLVTQAAFGPDGKTLATVCADGSARLWDAATGKPIGAPLLQNVSALAFDPKGRTLLTGGREGVAQFWAVPQPLPGDAEQVLLWTKIITGGEWAADDIPHRLDADAIRGLRRRWERRGAMPPL